MAEIITQLVDLNAKENAFRKKTQRSSPRITIIKRHNSRRQGNNSEIVAAVIILRRLEQQVESQKKETMSNPKSYSWSRIGFYDNIFMLKHNLDISGAYTYITKQKIK